jgi:hydrogenase maturation protease
VNGSTPRTLVAGFGNVLRGDDGFGVEVVRRLQVDEHQPDGVELLEVGTGGIALAQALMTPYDRLVVVDAMKRGGKPGTVYVLRVDAVDALRSVDMHMAVPSKALGLAQAIGALPPQVFMVGCEPEGVDELEMTLSASVQEAVGYAVQEIRRLVAEEMR